MTIKIIKNSQLLKEFNFNLSESFDKSDLDNKKLEPYTTCNLHNLCLAGKFQSLLALKVRRIGVNSTDDSIKKFNLDLTQNKLNIKREKLFDDESIDIGTYHKLNDRPP